MIFPGAIEIATLLGNTLIGGWLKLRANKMEMEEIRFQRDIKLAEQRANEVDKAREFVPEKSTGFHWTRRTIALLGVFAILVWPKIVPVFSPDTPVVIGYSQLTAKWFTEDVELIHWAVAEGIVITPLDTMVILSILGLFMGSEIVKRRTF